MSGCGQKIEKVLIWGWKHYNFYENAIAYFEASMSSTLISETFIVLWDRKDECKDAVYKLARDLILLVGKDPFFL